MKTLIVYGSRRGTTRHCAKLISKTMGEDSIFMDVGSKGDKPDLASFDQIIIGANAFSDKLNSRIRKFIKKNLKTLLSKTIHLYICSGARNDEESQVLYRKSYPLQLLEHSELIENFGGRLDTSRESWIIKWILKKKGISDYDTLDKNRIIQWAVTLRS